MEEKLMKNEVNSGEARVRVLTNCQDAIKMILKMRGLTYKEFAERVGTKLQNVIDKVNKRFSITVATLIKYAEAADCEVVIRSKKGDGMEWVLTDAIRPEK